MTKANPENERQENGNETTAIHNHTPMKSCRRSPHFWARYAAVKLGSGSGWMLSAWRGKAGAEWIFALPAEGANSGCDSEPLLLQRGGFAMFMLARLVGGSFVALAFLPALTRAEERAEKEVAQWRRPLRTRRRYDDADHAFRRRFATSFASIIA